MSSPRVLVVTARHAQEPIGLTLRRADVSVVWAHSYAAAAQSLQYTTPHAIVLHEQALERPAAQRLSALADENDVPLIVFQQPSDLLFETSGASSLDAPQVSDLPSLLDQIDAVMEERGEGEDEGDRLVLGDLTVDLARRVVHVGRRPVHLTQKEFELVVHLMRHPGWVFTRQQLLDSVWGDEYVDPRVVTVHIGNLRKKIGDSGGGSRHIETVRNVGYRFVDSDQADPDSRSWRRSAHPTSSGGLIRP